MFSKLGDLASLARQASQMQGKMAEMQEYLKKLIVVGTAGAGTTTHLMFELLKAMVNADDREMLEDLVVAATNQALDKAREAAAAEMSKLTGGMDLSGMKETLSKFGLGS